MKFKHCRVCKGRMSARFSYCPQCGGHNPRIGLWSAVSLVVLLGVVALRFGDSYASAKIYGDQVVARESILIPVTDFESAY